MCFPCFFPFFSMFFHMFFFRLNIFSCFLQGCSLKALFGGWHQAAVAEEDARRRARGRGGPEGHRTERSSSPQAFFFLGGKGWVFLMRKGGEGVSMILYHECRIQLRGEVFVSFS